MVLNPIIHNISWVEPEINCYPSCLIDDLSSLNKNIKFKFWYVVQKEKENFNSRVDLVDQSLKYFYVSNKENLDERVKIKSMRGQVGFDYKGQFITDPTLDPSGRFDVDPKKYYKLTPRQMKQLNVKSAMSAKGSTIYWVKDTSTEIITLTITDPTGNVTTMSVPLGDFNF